MIYDLLGSSEREEFFQDVTLLVKGVRSVTESLENYVTFETLSGDNQLINIS